MRSRVAVVFGSTGGIGSQIVVRLREQKYRLGLFSRSQVEYEDAITIARSGDATSDIKRMETFMTDVKNHLGSIDVVVFAIGSATSDLRESFLINVVSLYNVLSLGSMFLDARVFVLSSLRGKIPRFQNDVYCINKAAVEMLVQTKRLQFPETTITVIRPGFVDTPFYKEQSKKPYTISGTPYPITLPDDIAKLIVGMLELSKGAKVTEIDVGEVLGERKDLIWKSRT